MPIEVLNTLGALRRLEPEWRGLATPTPLQSPAWLVSWWEAYGEADPTCKLATLAVRDDAGALLGLAPWYVRERTIAGPTLRFLGDGRAATDHNTLLCRSPEDEPAVVTAAANWVGDNAGHAWRRVRFEAIDADDRAMGELERLLSETGLDTERVADVGSFAAQLVPHGGEPSWDNYLATLSKSRRKRLRRWEREAFDPGRATVHLAQSEADRDEFWPLLVRLHRERRESLGAHGAFDDPVFGKFHELASRRLLAEGRLYLSLLSFDGRPAAVDYALKDAPGDAGRSIYVYQGGIANDAIEHHAGHLSQLAMTRWAIESGLTGLDLLRGDEPYKRSWGANRRLASTLHVRPRDAAGAFERWAGTAYRRLRGRSLVASE